MIRILALYTALFAVVLFSSCGKDYVELNDNEIMEYLTDNNITNATKTDSGLYYSVSEEGTGTETPDINSDVVVYYTGTLTNGDVFDSRTPAMGAPIEFPLRNVILGWQEGMQLMKKGEKATLLIPAHLGYGSLQQATIPANSVLIFEVELVNFN